MCSVHVLTPTSFTNTSDCLTNNPITGLYPGTHNIIADQFIDNEEKNYFDKSNEQSTGQLKWYGIN